MADITVQVSLTLRDQLSTKGSKALETLAQGAEKATRAAVQGAGADTRARREVTEATEGASRAALEQAKAQEAAGGMVVRATKQGSDAIRDLSRASKDADRARFSGMRSGLDAVVSRSREAYGLLKKMTEAGGRAWQGAGQIAAGVGASAAVAAMAMKKPMDFETNIASMANTAFPKAATLEERAAGGAELRAAVDNAVRLGGGKREAAAEALDAMIASGAVEVDAAKKMLPVIQKFATASRADPTEIANILIRGVQNRFFTPDQAEEALDKAVVAGKEGGFELRDMARWLPQMMASAKGMQNMQGFETLLAAAQAAVTTAGSKDEAGNNLVNILAKLNSKETAARFKERGINLAGTLAAAREKGMTPLDAFVALIDKEIVGKDKAYKKLQARAAKAGAPEQRQIMEDMASLLEASAIGEIVSDRQALMGLVAVMQQRDYMASVKAAMQNADGAVNLDFANMQSTTSASVERAAQEKDMAMQGVLDGAGPAIRSFTDEITGAAREFPKLTTAVAGVSTVFASLAAGGAAAKGAGMLMGGGKAAGVAGAEAAGAAGTAAAQGTGGALRTGSKLLGRAGGALAIGASAYDMYDTETNDAFTRAEKNAHHVGTAGGLAGAWAGAKLGAAGGAAVGTAVPFLGNAAGAVIGALGGGVIGYFVGNSAGDALGTSLFSDGPAQAEFVHDFDPPLPPPPQVNNEITVTIDGAELTAHVTERQTREFRRH